MKFIIYFLFICYFQIPFANQNTIENLLFCKNAIELDNIYKDIVQKDTFTDIIYYTQKYKFTSLKNLEVEMLNLMPINEEQYIILISNIDHSKNEKLLTNILDTYVESISSFIVKYPNFWHNYLKFSILCRGEECYHFASSITLLIKKDIVKFFKILNTFNQNEWKDVLSLLELENKQSVKQIIINSKKNNIHEKYINYLLLIN